MRKILVTICAVILIGITATGACLAAVPATMSYQGRLTSSSGQPAADGAYGMVFAIYDAASDGTSLWTETQPNVQVTGGLFSVLLGSVVPLSESAFQGSTWLQTEVNGTTLTPRVQIVSSGYAIHAKNADTVPDNAITSAKLANDSASLSKISGGAMTSSGGNVGIGRNDPASPLSFADSLGDKISLWGQGEMHYGFGIQDGLLQIHTGGPGDNIVFGWGSSASFTETMRIKADGKVGIGTSIPQQALSINAGMNIDQANANNGTLASGITFGSFSGEGIASNRTFDGNNAGLDFYTNYANRMSITNAGNVGIGTSSPATPLSFANIPGDKINLWGQSGLHYGFGIQPALLQIHSDVSSSDIAFGYGNSSSFTETMRIKGDGKVGIGTDAPQQALSIVGGINIDQANANNGTLNPGISFGTMSGEGIASRRQEGANQWGLDFYTGWNNRMSITTGGNVGIGTTSPQTLLDVNGIISSGSGGFKFPDGTVQTTAGGAPADGSITSAKLANDSASLSKVSGGAMTSSSGNLGIGATDPQTALDVNGIIRSRSGGIRFPDGTTQTTAAASGGSGGWGLVGNAGTTAGTNFVGTTDSQPLELKANGTRALRLEYGYRNLGGPAFEQSSNVIGGHATNSITAGTLGGTVGGGGYLWQNDMALMDNPNKVTDDIGTVAGGANNIAGNNTGTLDDALAATVGGGWSNTANASYAVVAGGSQNSSSAYGATISGGESNMASGVQSAVGGGSTNTASGSGSTVSGGWINTASGNGATVPGGWNNTAQGAASFAAGNRAKANHNGAFVWGDSTNADFASTADNQFGVRATGGIRLIGDASGGGLSIQPHEYGPNIVLGHGANAVSPGISGATIAGGYGPNTVTGSVGTVSGGFSNTAGYSSTVGGGTQNEASGDYATVGGGIFNEATGSYSTIPGGEDCFAYGTYSFAAGYRANADHPGAFVWADSSAQSFHSTAPDQFNVRATGGVRLFTAIADPYGAPSIGVSLDANDSGWDSFSDRNRKQEFEPVDGKQVLAKVAAMPISTWRYKGQEKPVRHMGPMAQDMHAAFGLGSGETTINSIDADGIALAAIQGLNEVVKEKDARIVALEGSVKEQKVVINRVEQENKSLRERLDKLEKLVTSLAQEKE